MPRLNWFRLLWLTDEEKHDYRHLCSIDGYFECLVQTLPLLHNMATITRLIQCKYDYSHDIRQCADILLHKINQQITNLNN